MYAKYLRAVLLTQFSQKSFDGWFYLIDSALQLRQVRIGIFSEGCDLSGCMAFAAGRDNLPSVGEPTWLQPVNRPKKIQIRTR
jgi:hypothetical protein